ncbi:MAG: DUF2934 domain-containing protein [Rhizobiaceae bacterium]|nr:DUF2934 domain-containing protein [Rhizobiaceae bacterium]
MPAKKVPVVPVVERIREIAYQLWIEAGKPEGAAEANWFEAERIAANESEAPKAKKAPARKKAA